MHSVFSLSFLIELIFSRFGPTVFRSISPFVASLDEAMLRLDLCERTRDIAFSLGIHDMTVESLFLVE